MIQCRRDLPKAVICDLTHDGKRTPSRRFQIPRLQILDPELLRIKYSVRGNYGVVRS